MKKQRRIKNRKLTVKIEDKEIELTPQQKKFCEIYTTAGEFFANGVQAYIKAYDIDPTKKGAYTGARSSAHRLLTNADVLEYIDKLLDLGGLNDEFMDKQLLFWATQKADGITAVSAIREYNKLKSRVSSKIKIETDLKIKIDEDPEGDYAKFLKEQIKKRAGAQ